MRIFRRLSDIITANLNDLIDRFEDPEAMLKLAIHEMENTLERFTSATARAIAGERLLTRDHAQQRESARHWRERAQAAVIAGDNDLARQALGRAHEHDTLADAIDADRVTAEQDASTMRAHVDAMRAKLAEARRMLATLSAKRQIVSARRSLFTHRGSFASEGFVRFERLHRRAEHCEAEAVAVAALQANELSLIDTELTAFRREQRIESELAEMKARCSH